ncbi:hypothetical protein [Streptomyces chrestomyceticus]|uniref:hypothetical protein n=1 Tax=Streptomyces chrestomyceticus TaxID=68185 RepID=UPI0033F9863F
MEIARRTTTACVPVPAPRPPADADTGQPAAPLATADLPAVERILEAAALLTLEPADRHEIETFLAALYQRLGAAQAAEITPQPATLPLFAEELDLLTRAARQIRPLAQPRNDLGLLAGEGRRILRYLHVGLGRGRAARAVRGLPVWADTLRSPR